MANRRSRRREVLTAQRQIEIAHDAMVCLDAVLDERERDHDLYVKLTSLMKIAIKLHRVHYPQRHKVPGRTGGSRVTGWSGRLGMAVHYGMNEHSYVCVFCKTDLATFNNNGKAIPAHIVKRFERHGMECAMRYLMERGAVMSLSDFNKRHES